MNEIKSRIQVNRMDDLQIEDVERVQTEEKLADFNTGRNNPENGGIGLQPTTD